jgi:cholesterol oxidase
MAFDFDVIVIGSGFGGAITACRLAQANYEVLVLERGRRWDKSNFPRNEGDQWLWNHDRPEVENGWLDLRMFKSMAVAQGAAVGGGSLIYANISCEAPRQVFDSGWPPEITYAELKPHYDTVAKFTNVQRVPDSQWTARMQLMRDAANKNGFGDRFRQLELAVSFDPNWTYEKDFAKGTEGSTLTPNQHGAMQGTCVHLGNCDIGCEVYAKNTLDRNYLYVAEQKQAQIRPLHLVDRIEPLAGGGYRVSFDSLETNQRVPGSQTARIVVVAAGSLGSTELLLRGRDWFQTLPKISPRLGQRWSSNGDFLTPAFYIDREVQAARGPTIASAIDFLDGSQGGKTFWIEDGGLPNLLVGYLLRKTDDPSTSFKAKLLLESLQLYLRATDPLRPIMPWFAQGVDAGNGSFSLTQPSPFSPGGKLDLDWDITESRPLIDAIVDMHKLLAESTGGVPLVPVTWSLFKDLVTPHPLGGCNMGISPDNGVVDHSGEVFGYRNLFVVDGAIVPRPLGVNPSRTIGALSERIAALIVADSR